VLRSQKSTTMLINCDKHPSKRANLTPFLPEIQLCFIKPINCTHNTVLQLGGITLDCGQSFIGFMKRSCISGRKGVRFARLDGCLSQLMSMVVVNFAFSQHCLNNFLYYIYAQDNPTSSSTIFELYIKRYNKERLRMLAVVLDSSRWSTEHEKNILLKNMVSIEKYLIYDLFSKKRRFA